MESLKYLYLPRSSKEVIEGDLIVDSEYPLECYPDIHVARSKAKLLAGLDKFALSIMTHQKIVDLKEAFYPIVYRVNIQAFLQDNFSIEKAKDDNSYFITELPMKYVEIFE